MTTLEAILLARRALRELCREAGIPPATARAIEADLEHYMWIVADTETPEDWREYLERTSLWPRKRGESH